MHWHSLRVELELGKESAVLAAEAGVLLGRGTIIYGAAQLLTDPLKEAAPLETQQRSVEDHTAYRHVSQPKAHRMESIVVPNVVLLARVDDHAQVLLHRELTAAGGTPVPALRTIGRILDRRGALDGRRRHRLPPPPRG